MTYEEEQLKFAEELKQVNEFITSTNQNLRTIEHYMRIPSDDPIYHLSGDYRYKSYIQDRKSGLEKRLQLLENRKIDLVRLLSQSPSERKRYKRMEKVGNAIEFMGSITPQHVSGRVYKVENSDGCGTFCLWFCIIDAIIVFIIYIATGGFSK